jgi:hypothetical protein
MQFRGSAADCASASRSSSSVCARRTATNGFTRRGTRNGDLEGCPPVRSPPSQLRAALGGAYRVSGGRPASPRVRRGCQIKDPQYLLTCSGPRDRRPRAPPRRSMGARVLMRLHPSRRGSGARARTGAQRSTARPRTDFGPRSQSAGVPPPGSRHKSRGRAREGAAAARRTPHAARRAYRSAGRVADEVGEPVEQVGGFRPWGGRSRGTCRTGGQVSSVGRTKLGNLSNRWAGFVRGADEVGRRVEQVGGIRPRGRRSLSGKADFGSVAPIRFERRPWRVRVATVEFSVDEVYAQLNTPDHRPGDALDRRFWGARLTNRSGRVSKCGAFARRNAM